MIHLFIVILPIYTPNMVIGKGGERETVKETGKGERERSRSDEESEFERVAHSHTHQQTLLRVKIEMLREK